MTWINQNLKGIIGKMKTANDVVKVAVSQIGVTESPKNSNRTKYGKAFGENGVPWCAILLWWCFYKAKASSLVPHNSNAADFQDLIPKMGGAWIMRKTASTKRKKEYLKQAKKGDIVTFDFGANDLYRRHVGIVESITGNYLICIEGNTSLRGSQSNGGMVCRQRRIYSSVCAAVRPAYINSDPQPYKGTYPVLPERGWFQMGDKGHQVELMQKLLIWAGYDCGKYGADGDFGNSTRLAVVNFELDNDLTPDGGFGTKCLQKAKELKR